MGPGPASVHPSILHTFNINISETSWPTETKLHLEHQWGGERLHKVLARSDQNSGFHGHKYLPYGYNGENLVSTLAPPF